jgi:hypothetical protein
MAGARHDEVEAALEQRPPVRQAAQKRDVVAAELGEPVGAYVREAPPSARTALRRTVTAAIPMRSAIDASGHWFHRV